MKHLIIGHTFEDFREAARPLLTAHVHPGEVVFEERGAAQPSLLHHAQPESAGQNSPHGLSLRMPKAFVELAETVSALRSPRRLGLLYEMAFRLTHGEPRLLDDPTHPLTLELQRMRKTVARDVHHTHAYVRFRRIVDEVDKLERFIAWHAPEHRTLRLSAPHFVRRFGSMRFSILTPDETAVWNLESLVFVEGLPRSAAPTDDALESLWRTYYASVFNPARLNVRAMERDMPRRKWKSLPEAAVIEALVQNAPTRTGAMLKAREASPSTQLVPSGPQLAAVKRAAKNCLLCPWAQHSTQTVFGEGPVNAGIMMVGEQPGDHEDLEDVPFVGPAGEVLERVMLEVGLPRESVYLTNAVKHFKFTREHGDRGQRRLHEKPSFADVKNCFGWLEAEVQRVKPNIIVALGATAGQAFFGPTFRLVRSRGQFFETPWAPKLIATYHPSAVLRAIDAEARTKVEQTLQADLAKVVAAWRTSSPKTPSFTEPLHRPPPR